MIDDKKISSKANPNERRRRKREIIAIVIIVFFIAIITYAEKMTIRFGYDLPVSNTISMFLLININLLLLILLIFLVFRNVVKLLYERKRKVMGAKLRTKLVVAFIALTLLPTTILFFFSINFITRSIEFWFNVPIEQTLENSLNIGRDFYKKIEYNNRFFVERIAYQFRVRKYMQPAQKKRASRYIQTAQNAFNLSFVEVYGTDGTRLLLSTCDELDALPLDPVSINELAKDPGKDNVISIYQHIWAGEIIRTIAAVPFGASLSEAQGFVVTGTLIPPEMSEKIVSVSRGFEEYQQTTLLKKPIQITYYITLSIVALLVVFCAVWFGFFLAKSITIPLKDLAEGTQKVAGGDLEVTIARPADDEIGRLVDSFNKMTGDLKASRKQLELSAMQLKDRNIELEERRQYIEIVLKNVSAGVITIDAEGFISTINKSAEKMLNLKADDILSKSCRLLLGPEHERFIRKIMIDLLLPGDNTLEAPLKAAIGGKPRSFIVRAKALKDEFENKMGVVMVFDDLTELEKAQRMAAWREVARRIAHEVKNPLTPITLSAQRLKRRYSNQIQEPVFSECTTMIIDQVELIRNLVNEFAAFARFPAANPRPSDIVSIIEEAVALYKEDRGKIEFKVSITEKMPMINIDPRQIKQALGNLIANAMAAIKNRGTITIKACYNKLAEKIRIEVTDNGPGIPDEDKTKLFTPYFSTKKTGMGLGLAIVSTIISDHNGTISVENNEPRGAKFIIEIPV